MAEETKVPGENGEVPKDTKEAKEPTVKQLQKQLADQEKMMTDLALENAKMASKIASAGTKLRDSVTIGKEEYEIVQRSGKFEGRKFTSTDVVNDEKLAKALLAAGWGGFITAKQRADNKAKHQARRKQAREASVVK